jgi:hypothetical protein
MQNMPLCNYWPTREHVADSIRSEAETVSEAVFLAVHQPMRLVKSPLREGVNLASSVQSEWQFLEEFLKEGLSEHRLLMPITGDSGIGKSHLVRWLDIQLRRRSDAPRRHIIRIPKSPSLKKVLEMILETLKGDAYDEIREKLRTARNRISDLNAIESFRAKLRIALLEKAAEAIRQKDRKTAAHAGEFGLPALLSDPVTGPQFFEPQPGKSAILADIALRVTEGREADSKKQYHFEADDFQLRPDINLAEASRPVREYAKILKGANPEGRAQAAAIMNQVRDAAIYGLLEMGDNQLTEIFLAVRRQLLRDKRELVLLIEDFAALAGIQKALLDALMMEGIRDGKAEFCVMRVAMAITEAYLKDLDTVRTRAVNKWKLEDRPQRDVEASLDAVVDMVGGYLNAARFGQDELDTRFSRLAENQLDNWPVRFVPPQDDEELNEQLDAFGKSSQGYPLFPFNADAIKELIWRQFKQADQGIRIVPRLIITEVLQPMLRDYREDFEKGCFPSDGLLNFSQLGLDADVEGKVKARVPDPAKWPRYNALLRYWGADPKSISDVRLAAHVYRAFNLEPLSDGPVPSHLEPSTSKPEPRGEVTTIESGTTKPVAVSPRTPPADPRSEDVRKLLEKYDEWFLGKELLPAEANQLRNWIAKMVASAIDWDRELLKPIKSDDIPHTWIYLPQARGGAPTCTADNALVTVCDDATFTDQQRSLDVRLLLRAIGRAHLYQRWDYPEAEEDVARYANFVERVLSQAISFLRSRYFKVKGDALPGLAQSLLVGGRILDVDGAHQQSEAKALSAILAPAAEPAVSGDERWDELRKECFSKRIPVQQALLAMVAVRQGGAAKIYGIDTVALLAALGDTPQTCRVTAQALVDDPKNNEDVRLANEHVRFLRRTATDTVIRQRQESLIKRRQTVQACLGPTFDKDGLVGTVRETSQLAQTWGVFGPDFTYDTFRDCLRAFQDAAVSEVLKLLAELDGTPAPGVVLRVLSRVDEATLGGTEDFVVKCDEFLRTTLKKLDSEIQNIGTSVGAESAARVQRLLGSLAQILARFQEQARP